MRILVTGARGMLGQDLCPLLTQKSYTVIETDKNNLDVTDFDTISDSLTKEKPDFIIHCAAYTNVDQAETDIDKAFLINGSGTENIAIASGKQNIPIVYISTDYVFDGTKKTPYLPEDKPNPLNVYGLSKLKGEEAIKKYNKSHYITRTSWLYGHKGKNFVETMLNLAYNKDELKVVDDQIGCPTWTVELSNGIIGLIETKSPFGTYNICGSGSTSWYGFAKEIFKLMNLEINLTPVKTKDFPRPAKRPLYSVMDNGGTCPDWRASLDDYIKLREAK